MSSIVAFVVVLVVSMIDSSQAVTCYQCNYTKSGNESSTTCDGTSFDLGTNITCSGPCSWQFSNHTSSMSYINIQRQCLDTSGNSSGNATVDLCAQYRGSSYNVFNYTDFCCYRPTTDPVLGNGTSYTMTTCLCQKDYCNKYFPDTVWRPQPPSSSSTTPRVNGMPALKPSIWAIIVVTIIATVPNIF